MSEPLPWLAQAVELEALATMAQIELWSDADAARADELLDEIVALMAVHEPVEPPVEPPIEPPVEPELPIITPPVEPPVVRPPSEAGEFPKYPPAVDFNGTVRRVPDEMTLAQAYAVSEPGDVISIDDGILAGGFTFGRRFAAPGILIKGRNVSGGCNPRSILPGSYTVSGDGHWFHHLRLTFTSTSTGSGSGHPFNVTGARNTWTRNWFTGAKGVYLSAPTTCHSNRICYNRWTTTTEQGNAWINLINGQMKPTDNWHHDTIIARNYMRQTAKADYNNSYLIHIGQAHASAGTWWYFRGFKIEYNLLIIASGVGYDKFVYLKHGVESFSYNTMVGPGVFINRHGSIQYSGTSSNTASKQTLLKCHGNWMEGNGFLLDGCGNDIRGNYIKAGIGIKLSNGYNQDSANAAKHQAASDSLLVGNRIDSSRPYLIGSTENFGSYNDTQGHKIRNVKIYGHSGTPTYTGGLSKLFQDPAHIETGSCDFVTGYGSYPKPAAAVKLTETDVGFEVAGQSATA